MKPNHLRTTLVLVSSVAQRYLMELTLTNLRTGALGFMLAAATTGAWAQRNLNPGIFPPTSHPYGLTNTEWSIRWLQWGASIPADENPFLDPDGRFCHVGQSGTVFFLGNNFGGSVVRSCTVPPGKSLYIPPGGAFCILGADATTVAGLQACVDESIAGITNVSADIDGVPVQDISRYLLKTPLFTLTLPTDNIFGLPPGDYQTLAAGWTLILKPLPPGQHVIHFHDEFSPFVFDVTYLITVDPGLQSNGSQRPAHVF